MDFMQMVPNPDEQGSVIGQTGSGKSVWTKKLIVPYIGKRQIIILDPKHDDIWNGLGTIVSNPDKIWKLKFPKTEVVIYRPDGDLASDYDAYDDIFEQVYQEGNRLLVVDETRKVVKNAQSYGKGLDDLCTRGRKRECTRIFGMQRPVEIPRICLSESTKFYVRYVVDRRDRETIAGFSNEEIRKEVPDRYGMYYVDIRNRIVKYFSKT